MMNILAFPGKNKKLNLTEEIGSDYFALGVFLLNDCMGDKTKSIEHQYSRDAAQITRVIFADWLHGKGAQPVAWSKLIDVLKNMKFDTLADEINCTLPN